MTQLASPTMQMQIHEFEVCGRLRPTKNNATPKIFRMKLFARNHVLAKSRFWYFMKRLQRVKKANGDLLSVKELAENPDKVKNYGIWLRYDSRTGTHNMYKEFRDISRCGAVSQMYANMSGSHRALPHRIQIIKVEEVKDEDLRRSKNLQLIEKDIKFPVVRHVPLVPKSLRNTFAIRRPHTYV